MWVPVPPRDFLVTDIGPFCLSLENYYCSLTTPLRKTDKLFTNKNSVSSIRYVKKQKPIAAEEAIQMHLAWAKDVESRHLCGFGWPLELCESGRKYVCCNRRQLIRSHDTPVLSRSDDDIPYPRNNATDKATLIQSSPGNQTLIRQGLFQLIHSAQNLVDQHEIGNHQTII